VPRGYVFYVHGGSFRRRAQPAHHRPGRPLRRRRPRQRLRPQPIAWRPNTPVPRRSRTSSPPGAGSRRPSPDEPVVAMAESAGAAILLAALHQAARRGLEPPEGVVLLSPWVDSFAAELVGDRRQPRRNHALHHRSVAGPDGAALPERPVATDPVVSPIFGDFNDFPPTLITPARPTSSMTTRSGWPSAIRRANGDLTLRLWTTKPMSGSAGRRAGPPLHRTGGGLHPVAIWD